MNEGWRKAEGTGGAEAPPQIGTCFVFIVISNLLFFLSGPSWSDTCRQEGSQIRGQEQTDYFGR
ncbi:hypothetical protein GCM10009425_44110 [Pseudomonas asuensis]|uniref:Uncharacterized protein n=1 Tax=Pseudomonas asuensis TaxID=1825787 RepID=A0ABQ2H3X6_9PSED|nr:hypothetical protein GCM10009425_44110 [Pseudomonas asuensis]